MLSLFQLWLHKNCHELLLQIRNCHTHEVEQLTKKIQELELQLQKIKLIPVKSVSRTKKIENT